MKNDNVITKESDKAKYLHVTNEEMEDFMAWDCSPKYIAVVRFLPKEGQEERVFSDFLKALNINRKRGWFQSPAAYMIPIAEQKGYELIDLPTGETALTNFYAKEKQEQQLLELIDQHDTCSDDVLTILFPSRKQ